MVLVPILLLDLIATSQLRKQWSWEGPTQQRPETGFDTVYITVKLNKTMNIWNISENVNRVMTNHIKDQDMQAGTLLLLVKLS